MYGSILESLLLGAVLLVGLALIAVATIGFMLWRYGRRKLAAFRSHGAVVGATAMWAAAAPDRWRGNVGVMSADNLEQWSSARVAKEMWRTVDRATAAVRTADEVGGPTAELPSLCRRLQAAAVDIDKVLRVDAGAPVPPAVRVQVLEVVRAATDVQLAAVDSAGQASGQRIRDLTKDAEDELALLDAGLVSMRSVRRPELPG